MVDKIMNIRILFYSFIGLHLIIWTVIPFITNNNLLLANIIAFLYVVFSFDFIDFIGNIIVIIVTGK